MHAGMSWDRLEAEGGLQWPCPDEEHPGSPFLHGWLWADDLERTRPGAVLGGATTPAPAERAHRRVPPATHHRTGARLVQHRACRSGGFESPIRSGDALDVHPGRRGRARSRRRRAGAGVVAAGVRSRCRSASSPTCPGAGVHHLPLPRTGRHQRADQRRLGPPVGHRRVQGGRGPHRRSSTARDRVTDLHLTADRPDRGRAGRAGRRRRCPPGRERRARSRPTGGARRPRPEGGERRHLLLPALHALQHHAGWISPGGLNLRGRAPPGSARPRPTASPPSTSCSAPTPPGHEPARPITSASTRPARSPARDDLAASSAADGAGCTAARAWGSASGPRPVFVQGVGASPTTSPPTPTRSRCPRPANLACACCAESGSSTRPASTPTARTAATGRSARAVGARARRRDRCRHRRRALGRGGAAFPTGRKWRAVADSPRARSTSSPTADESEPGTFKDRMLMEHDPFALVEALTIAGLRHRRRDQGGSTSAASTRWPPSGCDRHRPRRRAAGLLGADVAGPGRRFDIELRRGAGAYICGEETALFNSIEGFRGEPRNKPPYPHHPRPVRRSRPRSTTPRPCQRARHRGRGRRGLPAASAPHGLAGHPALLSVGPRRAARRLRGAVRRAPSVSCSTWPAVSSGDLQAVLLGGAAGRFVGTRRARPATDTRGHPGRRASPRLGRGDGLRPHRRPRRRRHTDRRVLPPRVLRPVRAVSRRHGPPARDARPEPADAALLDTGLLDDIARAMADASICGLGHTAATAVRSAIDLGLIGGSR